MKNVAVLTENGAFALFFRPHPRWFDSSRVPPPGNLPSKVKKILMPGGQPGEGGGWAQLELTDALVTKVIVFGHVSKKMLAPKANARDKIPSHFFARALAVCHRLSAFV